VQAILRKFLVKAQKHDKMDEAEKLLSISQCQTTVVYSLTVLSALGRKHSSVMVVKGGSTEYATLVSIVL
jgi:hypothetical protein